MKIKTCELIGAQLDWAVAKAVDFPVQYTKRLGLHCAKVMRVSAEPAFVRAGDTFRPSTDWSQGGPLIERHCLDIEHDHGSASCWIAYKITDQRLSTKGFAGETPLIAACRAIASTKLGEEIEVPEELVC